MAETQSQLKVDQIAARFSQLLRDAGTIVSRPDLTRTWSAFSVFATESVECSDDRLFFEAEVSSTEPNSFYIHFARTFYGREPKGFEWTFEVICDFVFPMNDDLTYLGFTTEASELSEHSPDREAFLSKVERQIKLWNALADLKATKAEIYIGESG